MSRDLTIFDAAASMELAVEGADRAHAASDSAFKAHARDTILEVGRLNPTFTADDIVNYCQVRGLPLPENGSAWGSVFRRLSTERLIIQTGEFRKSTRTSRHADLQRVWRLP
jgi:hypothetical protein